MAPPHIFGLKLISAAERDEGHVVGRIAADEDEIGIGRLHRAHHRHQVGRERRIALVVDGFEAGTLGVVARAVAGGLAEFRVGGDDRNGLGFRVLRHRDFEPAARKRQGALVAARDHPEVALIVELAIHIHAQHADGHLAGLHDLRHGRRDHVGGIRPDQQVDFVDADELGVDAGNQIGIALIIVEHELDRTAEQPALGVDVIAPDFQRRQQHLAVGGDPSGQRHAEPDLDRLGRARRRERPRQGKSGEQNGRNSAHSGTPSGDRLGDERLGDERLGDERLGDDQHGDDQHGDARHG